MRYNKILALAMSLCLWETPQIFANTSPTLSEAQLESALQKLSAQTESLQQEVAALKTQLKRVKEQKIAASRPRSQPVNSTEKYTYAAVAAHPVAVNTTNAANSPPAGLVTNSYAPPITLNAFGKPILSHQEYVQKQQEEDINYLIGSTVLSSPIINIHSAYDASDLIVNQSTMNEDLRFLQQRQTLEDMLGGESALPSATRPRVFLSGKVETQAFYMTPFQGPESTGIDLTGVELDVLAEASPWAFGFMSIDFDNAPLRNPLTLGSGNPINNSRLFLQRAFFTIGNLDKSPIYFSMGQMFVPFGDYTTYQLSNPVTKVEGRINNRAAVLGYYKDGLYVSGYALNGAANTATGFGANNIYEFGANGGYKYISPNNNFKSNLGVGFVNNIAEAQGYQLNGLGNPNFFQGFAQRLNTELLQHPVGGFNAHLSGVYKSLSMYSELVTALTNFAGQDLQFNGHGAAPAAFHIEGDYTFKIYERPSVFELGYEHTWESLALNLPQSSYIAVVGTSIWKNTIQTLEFRHDQNYPSSDTGGGICDPTATGVPIICPVPAQTHTQNQLLLQFGVYF